MRLTNSVNLRHISYCIALFVLCIPLLSSNYPSQLERVLERGTLVVALRNNHNLSSRNALKNNTPLNGEDNGSDVSFEHKLLQKFANELGVKLKIEPQPALAQLQYEVAHEEVDLGASDASFSKLFPVRYGLPYLFIKQQLIYKKGKPIPKVPNDLLGKTIVVEYGSHHAASLKQLQIKLPELRWQERSNVDSLSLIEQVQTEVIDYAIVNSNVYDISRNLFPEVRVGFDLSKSQEVSWSFSQGSDRTLYNEAAGFIQNIHDDGTLEQLTEEYFGHIKKVDYRDAVAFYRRVQTRLPQWKTFMKDSAEDHNVDWNLLAAMSYQESHWNADAKSYTGVRGLMMLTKATARDMKIKDRTDPAQSIDGGARYFKSIFKRLPDNIQGADRTWFSLAAYNVGFAHVEDARVLTQRLNGNPNKWEDVARRLPLLSKKKYYRTLRHGYARGREPVKYVQNIRQYYDILSWQDAISKNRVSHQESEVFKKAEKVQLKQDDRDLAMSLL